MTQMKKSTASKKHVIPKKTATNQKLKSGICTTISKKKVLNQNGVIRINIPETGIFLNVNLLIFNVKTPSM